MRDYFLPFPKRDSKDGGAVRRAPSGMVAGSAAAIGALAGCGGDGSVGGGALGEAGDMLLGSDGNDTMINFGEAFSIDAGGGDDMIFGAGIAEAIRAGTGDDVIEGRAGDDTIDGGAGDDRIMGGVGDDRMDGGADGAGSGGFDTAVYEGASTGFRVGGERASDGRMVFTVMDMDAGDGAVDEGMDELTGFEAVRFGDVTFSIVETGTGAGEILIGSDLAADGSATAAFDGGGGDDMIFGFGGGDTIAGGAGGDVIAGGAGDDTLYGHTAGIVGGEAEGVVDMAVFGGSPSGYRITAELVEFGDRGVFDVTVRLVVMDIETGGSAVDEGMDALIGFEVLRFDEMSSSTMLPVTSESSDAAEILLGTEGLDGPLSGGGGDDRIFGFDGDDRISGGGGNDVISAGAGADVVKGGPGDDRLFGHSEDRDDDGAGVTDAAAFAGARAGYHILAVPDGVGGAVVTVRDIDVSNGDEGVDILTGFEALDFGDGRSRVTGSGSDGGDILLGTDGDDAGEAELDGMAGDDTVFGYAGDDVIVGGGGDDVIDGGAGNDTVVFSGDIRDFQFTLVNGALVARDERAADGLDEGRDILMNVETLRFGSMDLAMSDFHFVTEGAGRVVGDSVRDGVFHGGGGGHAFVSREGSDRFQFLSATDSTSSSKTTISGFDGSGGDRIALADIEELHGLGVETMTDGEGAFTRLAHAESAFELDIRGHHADILDHVEYIGGNHLRMSESFRDVLTLTNGSGRGLPDLGTWFEPAGSGETLSFGLTVDGTDLSDAGIGLTLSTEGVLSGGFAGTSDVGARVTVTAENGERAHAEFTIAASARALVGTAGGESLVDSTALGRVVEGLGGDDVVRGGEGDDMLHGGSAMEGVAVGTDNDIVVYDDDFEGYRVWAELIAVDGVKTPRFTVRDIRGADAEDEGEDTVTGFEVFRFGGDDRRVVGVGDAAGADDIVVGTNSDDVIDGDGGNDLIFGFRDGDVLNGGEGADTLMGGGEDDVLDGGLGVDVAVYRGSRNDYMVTEVRLDGGGFAHEIRDNGSNGRGNDGIDILMNVETLLFLDLGGVAESPGGVMVDVSSLRVSAFRGGSGPDVIYAGVGAATIAGGGGADTIVGGAESDFIEGGAGADSITGGVGADRILGGEDADTITGGPGEDLIAGGGGDDTISGNEDADTISGGEGADTIAGNGGADTIGGGAGDDTVTGGAGADVILGGAGDDVLYGHFADDHGVDGNEIDTVGFAGPLAGYDVSVVTEESSPWVNGTVTFVVGDIDGDGVGGDEGRDTVSGFEEFRFGRDTFAVVRADRTGDNGVNEIVIGSMMADTGGTAIIGGAGDDLIFGLGGSDAIDGGEGDDTVKGGDGNDVIDGGAGTMDTAVFRGNRDDYRITAVLGTSGGAVRYGVDDRTPAERGDDGEDTLTGIEILRFLGDASPSPVAVTVGLDMADVVAGSSVRDVIDGGEGDQEIDGGAGDDDITGGGGDDTITGGAGDDVIGGGAGTMDTAVFRGDRDDYRITAVLGSDGGVARFMVDDLMPETHGDDGEDVLTGIESFRFIGTSLGTPDDLTAGIAIADVIVGSMEGEAITAGEGSQEIAGGGGNDVIDGGLGTDTAVFAGPLNGYDVRAPEYFRDYAGLTVEDVSPSAFGSDGLDVLNGVERIRFGSETNAPRTFVFYDNRITHDLNEIMLGDDDIDSFYGGAGDDIVFGFGGIDHLVGGEDNDILHGGAGNDVVEGRSGEDIIHGGSGADTIRPGGGDDHVTVDTVSGNLDTVEFENYVQRFLFSRVGGEIIEVEDKAASGTQDHEGANTVVLSRAPDGSGTASGNLSFDGSGTYLTDNIHHESGLEGNRTYSNQNDIVRIDSYVGRYDINTGGGLDIIVITSETRGDYVIELSDFQRGRDKIAFGPDLGAPTTIVGSTDLIYLRQNGGAYFTKSDEFTIFIPNVPVEYDWTDFYFVIGETPGASGFKRSERKKEVVAADIEGDAKGGVEGGDGVLEFGIVDFDSDGDWAGMSGNPEIGSSAVSTDGSVPDESETWVDGVGGFSVCGDYLCAGMI